VQKIKGFDRPILKQHQRKTMLETLGIADEVIIFDEETPYDLIKKIRPDIITKGGDYKIENIIHSIKNIIYLLSRFDNIC
jgi:D-beta-D-heptose 7-phosphate kinase/D-beta-D-heptose 1-phosphate adenosyltransferase